MLTIIMAGGKGTRISSVAKDIPKPMIKVLDKPVLEHEIICLKEQGFRDIIITVGHLGQEIIDYFGDGKRFGVTIRYYFEKKPLGNAGALIKIKDMIKDDFLLINADSIFNVDINRFVSFHKKKQGLVTILTHPNSHPYDSSLISIDSNNSVISWLNKEDVRFGWHENRVNAGIHILSPQLLEKHFEKEIIDLDRDILKPLCGTGKIFAYDSPEYVRDMGTPDRLIKVTRDYQLGIVQKKNLNNKQKAVFLDRDGTINKYVGFLTNIDDFELINGVADAIKRINNSEYLAIVITNQPVVARGEVSFDELRRIHNKMETLLGEKGAYVDAIYFCPHHPHKGFLGEIEELKIDCDCRKPKPGMLFRASKDLNIDLKNSWVVGDSETDIEAGIAAGCKTILLNSSCCTKQTLESKTLLGAINYILGGI